LIYVTIATQAEVEQAEREAEQPYAKDVVPDSRDEDRKVRDKFVGYLGEIVYCREMGWKRVYPPQDNGPDAYRADGSRVEIKTRTRWYKATIPIRECEIAVLLYHYVDSKKQHCLQLVKTYDPDYLERHKWNIFITRKLWDACLKDVLIRKL
jgi:hypothetical protein